MWSREVRGLTDSGNGVQTMETYSLGDFKPRKVPSGKNNYKLVNLETEG